MKAAFLALERRNAGLIHLRRKKNSGYARCFFREQLFPSRGKTAGEKKESASAIRTVLSCSERQNACTPFICFREQ
jgi:hypothetical protein